MRDSASVRRWLSRMGVGHRRDYFNTFRRFMAWLLENGGHGETVETKFISLDRFTQTVKKYPLTVIKIDVEGGVINMFRGGSRFISEIKPNIATELWRPKKTFAMLNHSYYKKIWLFGTYYLLNLKEAL